MKPRSTLARTIAAIFVTGAAMVAIDMGLSSPSDARVVRRKFRSEPVAEPSPPMLAIVGLTEQRITIYGAAGKMLQSPVSSGQKGYETPAGIYSVVQKVEDHHSNIYDDASMPFMERLTWTGIALHAGDLPGYPASHGCVRMPHEFARELFGLTKLGLRVVVVRDDMAPVEIDAPAFFKPNEPVAASVPQPLSQQTATADLSAAHHRAQVLRRLQATASTLQANADAATAREKDAREAATRAANEAGPAARALKQAQADLAKAEGNLSAAEKQLENGGPRAKVEKAERAKAQATTTIEARRALLANLQAQSEAKVAAARLAEQQAQAAAIVASGAVEAADEAKQNMSPVSVFVSRKTQRLYVRKANMPIFEAPIFIRDPKQMIGTFVFTALDYDASGQMRWNVVSLFKDPTSIEPALPTTKGKAAVKRSEPVQTDVGAARAALEKLTISDEARERISEVVLPGSSLIITDEGPSIETGKDTDFVVIISGEPQGGIAIRQRPPRDRDREYSSDDDFFFGSPSKRGRRPGGGSGFPFWFN